jgi:type I restriction enzyme S subunit
LYLDTGSITENRIEKLQRFNIKEAPSRAKRIVENDDIIYSSVRPKLNEGIQ